MGYHAPPALIRPVARFFRVWSDWLNSENCGLGRCIKNLIVCIQMVLIVDDKAENIFSLRRTLELNGFDVDSAESGEEALKKILKNAYSLIILDVQMPGMDGFEVAEALSGYSKARDIPIIFLSAVNTDKKFIAKGYTSGGVDYVTKPVDPDIFILKVKTLHRLYEQNRELNNIRLELLEEVATRRKAEDELNEKFYELRSILEAIPQIAFTLRPNREIEFVNEHWFVYSDSATKMPVFHPEDQHILAGMHEAVNKGYVFAGEVRIQNLLTASFRYHLLKIIPVRQDNTILKWVGTFTDIHEQKTATEVLEHKVKERTEELVTKNKELENSNHELQQFASVASHDLKEPLRKIQIFSSIISEKLPENEPQVKDNMKRIVESSQRMSKLINDLLDFSRLSISTLFQKTDVGQLIKEIISDLELSIKEKNAIINVSELPVIDAVPGQIRQVFQNLISNSLKFSRAGKQPVIDISGKEVITSHGATCVITIRDNGIGFSEEFVDKIFTIFQRLNSRETYEGTGIGLAIVKKIIEKHNGTISARSTEGKGATFTITLPVHQVVQEIPVLSSPQLSDI